MRTLAACALLLVPAMAAADGSDDAEAYCGVVRGVAASESALMFSPQLFLDYGLVNANDAASGGGAGAATASPTQRLTFGLRYSFAAMYRGIVDRQHSDADCRRQRAASGLGHFLVENREQVSPAAVDAKLAVLRAALPKALEIRKAQQSAVERAHGTLEELQATEVRVDDLQAEIAAAEALRAGVPSGRSAQPTPGELLGRHRQADAELMQYETRLRMSQAFDISFRAGYDRFFGLRDDLPLFAAVTLTVNPAAFWQPVPEAAAARAREQFVRSESDGLEQKAELLAARMHALLAAERRRMGDVRTLLADVESRLRTLEGIESDKLRRFREASWFDFVRLKAEHEFLRVHVAELGRTLGEEGGG
jgi:hypothetical protein